MENDNYAFTKEDHDFIVENAIKEIDSRIADLQRQKNELIGQSDKTFLGDAVYVSMEHDQIRLTTEYKNETEYEIYMNDEVFQNFMLWLRKKGKIV